MGKTIWKSKNKKMLRVLNKEPYLDIICSKKMNIEIIEKEFITKEEKKDGDFGINVSLLPWIILSKDNKMIIPTDSVLTVVEPLESVTQMYLDKMKTFQIEEEK